MTRDDRDIVLDGPMPGPVVTAQAVHTMSRNQLEELLLCSAISIHDDYFIHPSHREILVAIFELFDDWAKSRFTIRQCVSELGVSHSSLLTAHGSDQANVLANSLREMLNEYPDRLGSPVAVDSVPLALREQGAEAPTPTGQSVGALPGNTEGLWHGLSATQALLVPECRARIDDMIARLVPNNYAPVGRRTRELNIISTLAWVVENYYYLAGERPRTHEVLLRRIHEVVQWAPQAGFTPLPVPAEDCNLRRLWPTGRMRTKGDWS